MRYVFKDKEMQCKDSAYELWYVSVNCDSVLETHMSENLNMYKVFYTYLKF
jgi:hypothetical protein